MGRAKAKAEAARSPNPREAGGAVEDQRNV